MEEQNNQEYLIEGNTTRAIIEERQLATQDDPDDWFDSSDSEKGFPDRDQNEEQPESEFTNPDPFQSTSVPEKEQLVQIVASEEKPQHHPTIMAKQFSELKIGSENQNNYKSFYHTVDEKLAILMYRMIGFRLVNLLDIADLRGRGTVELFLKNKQLIVKTVDKTTADEAINKISDFIDEINVVRLELRTQLADKLQNCRKIKRELLKRKVLLLNLKYYRNIQGWYLGGQLKPSQLKKICSEIKSYTIFTLKLYRFRNRRSYRLILDQIFQTDFMMRQMRKLSGVSMLEVDVFTHENDIRVILNIHSTIDISALQYESFITQHVQKFFVVSFILQTQPYFQKLAVLDHPQIKFMFVKERNHKNKHISYLFIIAEMNSFWQNMKKIQEQVQKVGQHIIGMRFFNNLFPLFSNFIFDSNFYYVTKFPKVCPYSMIVMAKQRLGLRFEWKQMFLTFQTIRNEIKANQIKNSAIERQKT